MKLRLGFFLTTCMVPAASVFAQEPAKTAATPNVPGQVAPAPGLLPATTPPKLLPIRRASPSARQVGYETGTAQSNMTTTTITAPSAPANYAPAAVPTYPPQPAAAPVYTTQPAYQTPQTYQAPQTYQPQQTYSNTPAQTYGNTQTYTAPQPYNSSPIYQTPAPAATPKTEVQRQLEMLYQKDGRQAPAMTLQEMPQQQGSAPAQMQAAPTMQQPQQMQPQQQMGQQQFGQQQQAEQPKPGFLQRIFSFHKRAPQQQAQPQATQMPRTNNYMARPGQPAYGTPRPVTQPARPYQPYTPPPPPAFRYPVAQQPGQAQMPPQNTVVQTPNGYQPPAPLPTTQPGIAPPQPLPPPLTNVPNVVSTAEARQIEESPTLEDNDSENMDILDKEPAAEESPFSGLKLQTPESDAPATAEAEEDIELPSDPPKARETAKPKDDSTAKMRQLAAIHDKAGFKGFCPVALKNNRELVPCRGDFQAEYRGRLYEFSSAQAKAEFEKSPHEFAPVNSGFDTVALVEDEERKDGSLDHAAWYRGRLYMFMNQANLDIFLSAPEEYAAEEVRTPKVPAQDAPQLKSEAELEADEAPVLNAEPDDSDPFVDDEMEDEPAAAPKAEAPKADAKTKPAAAAGQKTTMIITPRSSKGK